MDLDSKIFLSHSKHDEEDVKHLRDWLVDLGLNSFVTFDNIRRLEFWKLLAKELRASACLLLIMTRNSLESTNVHKEIILADKYKKKIFIYQIEEVAEFPEEVDAILTPIQRIESYKHGTAEGLKRLAEMLLVEAGLGDDEIKEKIDGANVTSQEKQRKAKFELQSNLERWKDEYLDYKWNGKHLKGVLAGIEIEHLHDLASQLGLSRAETKKLQVLGKRDRKKFMDLLNGTLNKTDIRAKDIFTLEDRRIKYEVSRKEVREVVEKRSKIPHYSLDKIDAGSHSYRNIDWLLESLSKKKKELEQSAHNRLRASADAPRKEPEQLSTAQKSDSKNASKVSTPSITDQAAVQSIQASNDNDQEVTVQAAKTRKGKDAETHQHKPRRDQDNKDYEAIDSTLNSGTRPSKPRLRRLPSKPRLRRFFNCNDQFLVVSEIFLGNEIKRLDVTHIERTDNFFIFDGRIVPSATKIGASSAIIRSINEQNTQIKTTREFTQIIVSEFTIKFVQEGFESYVVASVDPVKDNYARFIAFLEGVGIPVSKVEAQQHLEHPAVKRRREAEEFKNKGVRSDLKAKRNDDDTNVNSKNKTNKAETAVPSSSQKNPSDANSLEANTLWSDAIAKYNSITLSEELAAISRLTIASEQDETLYVNPDLDGKSQTARTLKVHQINGNYLGKVLIHLNTSTFRGKNGLVVFEKGFLISQILEKTRLFCFGNLENGLPDGLNIEFKDNMINLKTVGYCAIQGCIVKASYMIPQELSIKLQDFPSLLGSILQKADYKARYLGILASSLVKNYKVLLEPDIKLLLAFAKDLYDHNLSLKASFEKHFVVLKDSLGTLPVPSEVMLLLNCGLTQSLLITAFGLHFIGRDVFPVKIASNGLNIKWENLNSIEIEATDFSAKTLYIRISSEQYNGVLKFVFSKGAPSFSPTTARFASIAKGFVEFIRTAAGLFAKI
jgi:hypothetical protein